MTTLRDAVRALRATPIVSAVAVLSLALGIGATTAMFSILDALLLRSLPVREPHRLVQILVGPEQDAMTNPIWEQLRDRQRDFSEGAAAWGQARFDLARAGETDYVDGLFTSGNFFELLGVRAAAGRLFASDDDQRGGGPRGAVAVISYAFWQRRYGGAPDAIGRTIVLQHVPFTIVGVAARGFTGPDVGRAFDVAVPIGTEPLVRGSLSSLDQRSYWWLTVVARLRQGQTTDEVAAALRALQPNVRNATLPVDWRPEELAHYLDQPFQLQPAASGTSFLRDRYARPMQTLMVVVVLVLLIACANIANLLMARAAARRRELSVRLALGATRFKLARQLFAESLLVAGLGSAGGLVVAEWGSRLLVRQLSSQASTVFLDVGVDARMLAFTAAVAVCTAILFGTAPAWRAGRVGAGEALAGQARGPVGEPSRRLASALVVAQVALSLVLIVAAGLFVRTFASLATRDLGFDRKSVLIAVVNAQRAGVDPAGRPALFERLRRDFGAVAGVATAASSVVTPVSGSSIQFPVDVPDRPDLSQADRSVYVNEISPAWFRTYGTTLMAGRDFNPGDTEGAPGVAIVNQMLAQRIFGRTNPIGRTLVIPGRPDRPAQPLEIVGLVQDAVYRNLRRDVPPTLYLPLLQRGERSALSFGIRTTGPAPVALTRAVTDALERADPSLSVTFRALDDQVNATLVQERLLALLSGFFGGLALLLAGLGLYGVTAYGVSRRRIEMGIRMALGATPAGVVGLVISRVGMLVGLGIVAGGLASYWAASLVSTLTFGVRPRDLGTLLAAAAILASIGLLAGWLPARRASRIDPASVLRDG